MAEHSKIEWTDATWNPVRGCTKISPGCKQGFDLRLIPGKPGEPLRWWVIAGGESGPGARPMAAEWVKDIRDQCRNANVAFFFKQWGGQKRRHGRELDGRTWDEMPELVI